MMLYIRVRDYKPWISNGSGLFLCGDIQLGRQSLNVVFRNE